MTVPRLSLTTDAPLATTAAVLVVGVQKTPDGPRLASDEPALAGIASALGSFGVSGSADELVRLPAPEGSTASLALIGLGGGDITTDALRYAAGSAARQLTGVASLALALPVDSVDDTRAVLEGAAVGAWAYTEYRSATLASARMPAAEITVHGAGGDEDVAWADALATGVHSLRDLVSASPLDLYPQTLADAAVALADGLPIEVDVLDEDRLREGGYGGILGVGQGSTRPPRLVVLRYSPTGATKHVSLVGKGITFDSGGLSLKPPVGMVGMKYDMTGAATVLAVIVAVARLGLPVQVTARMCIAENMPSGSAIRPNDVLRIHGGKTVEVLNTDAEGRLVLADGLVAASEEHPDALIDVATLTGAARVAMGERVVPIMGDEALNRRIVEAGAAVGETYWPMPLPGELRELINSDIADIANVKPGATAGGMLIAGHFLKYFVGSNGDGAESSQIPWSHLDIAGAANNGGRGFGFSPKGPTGVAVRTLIALIGSFADAE